MSWWRREFWTSIRFIWQDLPRRCGRLRVALADCEPQILDTQLMVLVKEAVRVKGLARDPSSPILEERPSAAWQLMSEGPVAPVHHPQVHDGEGTILNTVPTLPRRPGLPMMLRGRSTVGAPAAPGAPVPEPPNSASSNTSGKPPSAPPRSASTAAMMSTFGIKPRSKRRSWAAARSWAVPRPASCGYALGVRLSVSSSTWTYTMAMMDNLYIPRPLAYIPAASRSETTPSSRRTRRPDEEEEELTAEELADVTRRSSEKY